MRMSLINEPSSTHLHEAQSPFVTFYFFPPNKSDKELANNKDHRYFYVLESPISNDKRIGKEGNKGDELMRNYDKMV